MAEQIVKGQQDFNTDASQYNAENFHIRQEINKINTAEPATVGSVSGGGVAKSGTVSATPIVNLVTGTGEGMQQSPLFTIPYFRYQGGENAFIVDPKPEDVGLNVYAMRDTEVMKEGDGSPCNPGSARRYSKGDGFFFSGFLGKQPRRYVMIDDEGITLDDGAGGKIELKAGKLTITAPNGVTIDTPETTLTGQVRAEGNMTAGQISMQSHRHTGVEAGPDTSGGPV
ncbi:hypothetical protein B5F76_09305 [Desulfovibrio sp. An276]|uniref:hypothetical protein n=1 Tax=Desulfovibrio sp. An276 TaxID=1965618 RepID=UPI000B3A02EE|nr:hypothetical protein [Desulfovibrio sp. An276]OUO51671.1 hypothetical protein B5F76_09305 [Desulfovibrio sp. An276]